MHTIVQRSTWITALLALISCVTVNIYFPAAAAEKAADSIIQDVWHEQSTPKTPTPTAQPNLTGTTFSPRHFLLALLSGLSNNAYANNINFNVSAPKIEQLKTQMAGRFSELKPLFDSGAIGLTDDGYLAIRDAKAAPMAQRAQLSRLIDKENADRKALYQAIADANNQPNWFSQIQSVFAGRWIAQAQTGWYYQAQGHWIKK